MAVLYGMRIQIEVDSRADQSVTVVLSTGAKGTCRFGYGSSVSWRWMRLGGKTSEPKLEVRATQIDIHSDGRGVGTFSLDPHRPRTSPVGGGETQSLVALDGPNACKSAL